MNLVIDVGNSFVKLAVFRGNDLLHRELFEVGSFISKIESIQVRYDSIRRAIVSSVAGLKDLDVNYLEEHFNLLVLSPTIHLPFINLYKTPNTLGVDRIALVCAAIYNYEQENVLVIDAGSCITYDVVTSKKEYLGGAISPGLTMRYKALNHFTAKLPLLDVEMPDVFIGTTTNTSIHSGVVNGVLNEIDGFVEQYKRAYPDLKVILTGGDAIFLSKQLKSSIFVNSNFLLEGLNYILKFNSNS